MRGLMFNEAYIRDSPGVGPGIFPARGSLPKEFIGQRGVGFERNDLRITKCRPKTGGIKLRPKTT